MARKAILRCMLILVTNGQNFDKSKRNILVSVFFDRCIPIENRNKK